MDREFIEAMKKDIGEEAIAEILNQYLVTLISRFSGDDLEKFSQKLIEKFGKK